MDPKTPNPPDFVEQFAIHNSNCDLLHIMIRVIDPNRPTFYTRLMKPGEELVQELEQLRQRLNQSRVEATNGLREAMGDDCTFFRRSMEKFIRNDYMEIRTKIGRVGDLIGLIEGNQ